MPKIDAPTVAEHHQRQRARLLAACAEILADRGVEGVTLAAVGAAAGLARSSVYQYFDSAPALIAAVVEDAFPPAIAELRAAVGQSGRPDERIDTFLRAALRLATEPTHRALSALADAELPEPCRVRLAELHGELYAPLRAAIRELGVPAPELTTGLVLGVLAAATRAVIAGARLSDVEATTLRLLHQGLTSAAG